MPHNKANAGRQQSRPERHGEADRWTWSHSATWQDDQPTRDRIWELLKTTPEPVGYDPALFWPSAADENFGVLKLTPWRLEVWSLAAMSAGKPAQVWRQEVG